jgi:hypothetical protein
MSTGYCCQRSSGAEKKALDVHSNSSSNIN